MASRSTKALVIEPSSRCYLIDLLWDEEPEALDQRRQIVGGSIEGFSLGGSPGAMYYLNEDGKYTIGRSGYNTIATELARPRLMAGDWIVGNALVVGCGAYGHDAEVPEWVVSKVKSFPTCVWDEG